MADDEVTERLELPDVVSWAIFPFEGDMRVRELQPRLDSERIRNGDPGGDPCFRCARADDDEPPVWQNDHEIVAASLTHAARR